MITNEEPADKFKKECKKIHIEESALEPLCNELESSPTDMTYDRLNYPLSLLTLKSFIIEIEDLVNEDVYDDFMAYLNHCILSSSVKNAFFEQRRVPAVNHNSHLAAVLTLVDIMAGCSKMGMGNEDSIGIPANSRELAEKLFEDTDFTKILRTLWKMCQKEQFYQHYMVPFKFASGVLAPDSKARSLNFLTHTFEAYQEIQKNHFGNCLTEAALKAKETYQDFFFAEEIAVREHRNMFSTEFNNKEIPELILKVSADVQQAIKNRVNDGVKEHLSVAKRWDSSPSWKIIPKGDDCIANPTTFKSEAIRF